MYVCLRVDLDYVPWDTPDAEEFGHGEPAMLLRLLEFARGYGYRFQFFVSNRVLRAFPAVGEAVLNEGHDLDWLCKHPEEPDQRFRESVQLFQAIGHRTVGLAVRGSWPMQPMPEALKGLRFLSSVGTGPDGWLHFPVEAKSDRDAVRAGLTVRSWEKSLQTALRDAASRNRGVTLVVRPQVLARIDPALAHLRALLELAGAVGLPLRTLRQLAD